MERKRISSFFCNVPPRNAVSIFPNCLPRMKNLPPKSWIFPSSSKKTNLSTHSSPDLSPLKSRRTAILGIGSDLYGDDAAGLLAARALLQHFQNHLPHDLLVLETGPAPENFTGQVRRFQPEAVLLVDAARMGVEAGALRMLNWQETQGWGGSTHTLPLSTLAEFLTRDLGCPVFLLGHPTKVNHPRYTCLDRSVYGGEQDR